MKLAIPEQMAAIDAYAINELGIPGMVLMENAALKVVEAARRMLDGMHGRRIVLLAGKGNNGGDAFAAARHLFNNGADVLIYMVAGIHGISGDAALNLDIVRRIGVSIVELAESSQLSAFQHDINQSELIIDGIFGTGFKGEIKGLIKDIIEAVNSSSKKILSIDIPSGINGETGKASGTSIKATKTVTFCLPKTGLVIHPGCEYTGELVVADIGIPIEAVEKQAIMFEAIDRGMVASIMPGRPYNSNKGDYGRMMIVSGSTGMTGSGCLCAKAALRSGAGLVYLGVPSSLTPIYSSSLVEPIVIPLDDSGAGSLSAKSAGMILARLEKMDAAAVGPGLSTGKGVSEAVFEVVKSADVSLVLDADALNIISSSINILKKLKKCAILTPHPGEMSRLTGLSINDIQADRINTARNFAGEWGAIVVLKGSRTVIAHPDGRVYINTCGNPGMATAGTGDVLTGIITGLLAQGVEPAEAAVAGVYLHGMAGDLAAAKKGMAGMIAGDIIEELPYVIKGI